MKQILLTAFSLALIFGCTKLDEKLNGQLSDASVSSGGGSGNASALLTATYDAMMGPFQNQDRLWCLQEHTTDECIGPTRAGDWDDNGVWRVLHSHQWDANHQFNAETFKELGKVVFAATDLLRFAPTPAQAAEAKLLRAYASYALLDGWNQVPYRVNTADPREIPQIRAGVAAADFIISELTSIIADLPVGPANRANKDAARVLLMKLYLNKGVYANRAAPTFAAADMNLAIAQANLIQASSRAYALTPNYFNNFTINNNALSTENIWTAENIGSVKSGNVRSRWYCTLHYNQNPSGWNGFTTLGDFYDKFEMADTRRKTNFNGITNVYGYNMGFLEGPQATYKRLTAVPSLLPPDSALKDRTGAPLSFTKAVKAIETGSNLEVTGVRVIKYAPDLGNGDNKDNDYVYFRYADVLLMKAEALLRGGTDPSAIPQTATMLTSMVRARAGLAPLSGGATVANLLDERAREFYWEATRRTDLIRFGKFLDAWQEKPASSAKSLLFPIPSGSLAANPNITQNSGY